MGLIKTIHSIERMSTQTPLGLVTLQVMGIIHRHISEGYILTKDLEDESEDNKDDMSETPIAPTKSPPPSVIPIETEGPHVE